MILYCAVLYVVIGLCKAQEPEDEPYVVNFDSPVYVCPDDVSQKFVNSDEIQVERYNESTSIMLGIASILQPLEGCQLVEIIVEKTINDRGEIVLTHEICDLCKELHSESNYYKYLKYFGLPESCPIEGDIRINDFIAECEDLPVNKSSEGRYQVTLNFYDNPDCDCKDNRTFRGCMKVDFLIEPQ